MFLCHPIFSLVSLGELFSLSPHPILRGRLLKMSAEEYAVYSLSAITFALSFDSLLPLSQPSSLDKKEPLLRCFARHYETVAMDTQSEQAPHTGSRIENDRCNISHFRNSSFFRQHTGWWTVVLKMPKIKTLKIGLPGDVVVLIWGAACFVLHSGLNGVFRLILVFVVSPWRDDLYYLGWEIKEGFLTDLMKLASYKPQELVQIAQQPRSPAKCGHEGKHCMEKQLLL